jgi:hypothetical protein
VPVAILTALFQLLNGGFNFGVTWMRLYGIALLLTASFATSSATFAAPANLLDKTITFAMTTTAPWKTADGRTGTGSRITTTTVYISNAGRIFARRARQDSDASESKDFEPAANNWRFIGDKLTTSGTYVSGAYQTTLSFDPSGQSCTVEVHFGHEAGRAMTWKGANGITYTGTGPWVASNFRCSIASGNAFAGH